MNMTEAKEIHLKTPLLRGEAKKLKVGDIVYLSGVVYTARDQAHLRIKSHFDGGKRLPFELKGFPIYHAGPNAIKGDGWVIAALGPTTSIRMEPYSDLVGSLGVSLIVGKGGMRGETLNALKKYGMAYLSAPHGCGVLGAEVVKKVEDVHWLDLGIPEAVWELRMENWGPLIVGMDSQGGNLYREVMERARRRLSGMR
jgi:fumarate hydratase subunit beta